MRINREIQRKTVYIYEKLIDLHLGLLNFIESPYLN